MMRLSTTFRSVKLCNRSPNPPKPASATFPPPHLESIPTSKSDSDSRSWCVYLIISTNSPVKTYVGTTINVCRRLKQHNGELKGGAKASRAGRPWRCACIIRGFEGQSEACSFETKWKLFSRKLPRQKKNESANQTNDDGSLRLLQHRQVALDRVMCSLECSHVEIEWKLNA